MQCFYCKHGCGREFRLYPEPTQTEEQKEHNAGEKNRRGNHQSQRCKKRKQQMTPVVSSFSSSSSSSSSTSPPSSSSSSSSPPLQLMSIVSCVCRRTHHHTTAKEYQELEQQRLHYKKQRDELYGSYNTSKPPNFPPIFERKDGVSFKKGHIVPDHVLFHEPSIVIKSDVRKCNAVVVIPGPRCCGAQGGKAHVMALKDISHRTNIVLFGQTPDRAYLTLCNGVKCNKDQCLYQSVALTEHEGIHCPNCPQYTPGNRFGDGDDTKGPCVCQIDCLGQDSNHPTISIYPSLERVINIKTEEEPVDEQVQASVERGQGVYRPYYDFEYLFPKNTSPSSKKAAAAFLSMSTVKLPKGVDQQIKKAIAALIDKHPKAVDRVRLDLFETHTLTAEDTKNSALVGQQGVRARQDVDAWTPIGEYTGHVMKDEEAVHRRLDPRYLFEFEFKDQVYVIDGKFGATNLTKFVNDGRTDIFAGQLSEEDKQCMNCVFATYIQHDQPRIFLVTTKRVFKGDSLWTDYGQGYWNDFVRRERSFTIE